MSVSPNPCDPRIYQKGTVIMVLDARPWVMESIIKQACEGCNLKIDWHYVGGRAVVKTLSDPKKAFEAMKWAIPTILNEYETGL